MPPRRIILKLQAVQPGYPHADDARAATINRSAKTGPDSGAKVCYNKGDS